jgi:GMP synthase (glutamine-hydrolysing)
MKLSASGSRAAQAPPRLLCIEFEPDAGPGRLALHFKALGAEVHVVPVHSGTLLPSIDGFHAVIPLGGAMNAEDDDHFPFLGQTVSLLRAAAERGVPVLGVCLGAQLLARALGARIWRRPQMEVGYFPIRLTPEGRADRLFSGFNPHPVAFQWHEDAFDLPSGATLLADSDRDTAQAFKLGTCYGVQFHPEVTALGIACWCGSSAADLTSAATPTSKEALLAAAHTLEVEFAAQTAQLCRNWLDIVNTSAVRQSG